METCDHCGEEIVFRYIDGQCTPIHLSGGWCSGYRTDDSSVKKEDECYPTDCPECGERVFFIRHNGGSVWVDELGPPWPKHACFDDESDPIWYGARRSKSQVSERWGSNIFIGKIIRMRRYDQNQLTCLAIDDGLDKRLLTATKSVARSDFLNRLVIVDWEEKSVVSLDDSIKLKLEKTTTTPECLGLSKDWVTFPKLKK